MTSLDELLTSLRELEEFEAIHEEELIALDDETSFFAELEEFTTTELEELFTSLRELEEFEAIHEDELQLDPVDELVELSFELRMTSCDELLTSTSSLELERSSAH